MENQNFIRREQCLICRSSTTTNVLTQEFADDALWKSITDLWPKAIKKDWEGVSFRVSFCPHCDLYFTESVPAEAFESRMLDRYEFTGRLPLRERTMGVEQYSRLAFECEKISSLLGKKPHDISVLEFGSGFGHWLLMAKAFNYETTGIEIYEDRIAYAVKNGLTIHRSLGDVKDESFDFIFSNQVFEHLVDPLFHLEAVVKKLKKGGIMQIGVPYGGTIKSILKHYNGTPDKVLGPIGHINGFTSKALRTLGEKAGLTLLSPAFMRRQYRKTMVKNRNLRYIYDIVLAQYKQNNSCYLYFQKP